MLISPFASPVLGPLVSSEDTRLFSDESLARAMLAAESALARAGAAAGLVPREEAEKIAAAAGRMEPDLAAMGAAAGANGTPVAALVRQLRAESGSDSVHAWATSQDIVDTAFVLQLREFLAAAEAGILDAGTLLAALAETHAGTVMAARTRWRLAAPTTFGLKAANWLAPLARHLERLREMRPRVLVAQFGGPAGTRAAGDPLAGGDPGGVLAAAFASELGLGEPGMPWHQQRDGIAEAASWLAMLCAMLAKIAGDILLLQQDEVGEVSAGAGASTSMPHKRNPVGAETVCALGTFAAAQLPAALAGVRGAHERGGEAWTAEWLAFPPLAAAAAGALRCARETLARLEVFPPRMRANLGAGGGFALAGGFAAALAGVMPAEKAEALIMEALASAEKEGRGFIDALRERCDADLDWERLARPETHVGDASALVARALERWAAARCS